MKFTLIFFLVLILTAYFNDTGTLLYKKTAYRNKTECNFIKKGLSEKYFDNFKLVKSYDLIELF